jgi:peptidyl-prolyl cis-trans isomerase SurA
MMAKISSVVRNNILFLSLLVGSNIQAQTVSSAKNIVDEVVWVVGDEAILKSDIETMRLQALQEGTVWNRKPELSTKSKRISAMPERQLPLTASAEKK